MIDDTSKESRKENARVVKAAGVISTATLLSRVLGFVRDMMVARFFGATFVADAFFVAFRIPSMLRELFAEGSMSAGFIPVFTEYLEKRGKGEAKKLVLAAFTSFSAILFLLVSIGILLAPYLVRMIAPGFSDNAGMYDLTVSLSRVMFPYLFFIGLSALSMGVLNSLGMFGPPAMSPAVYNVAIISSLLFLVPYMKEPIFGLAIGIVLGGVCQLALQLPFLIQQSMGFGFASSPFSHPGVRQIGRLIGPVIIGLSATQVNLLANTIMASYLKEGSVSYLYYAMRLIHFPLGIFGIAIATAILPTMSRYSASNDMKGLTASTSFGLRMVFFITVPAMMGLLTLRIPIVNLLYQRGSFDLVDTLQTASALFCYALGLWSFAGLRIVTHSFYALKDTKTPVKVSVSAVIINIAVSLALMKPLGHIGLALGTVSSSVFGFCVLSLVLRKKMGGMYGYGRRIATSLARTIVASFVLIVISFPVSRLGLWESTGGGLLKSVILLPVIVVAFLAYLFCQYLIKSEEFFFLKEQVSSRVFGRKKARG